MWSRAVSAAALDQGLDFACFPTPINLPSGYVFHGRCIYANERCVQQIPRLMKLDSGAYVACHGFEEKRI
jgi:peptide/nickel transport system ATP-binding protein